MSNREKCNLMLDGLTEEQLVKIIELLQDAIDEMEEAEDDAYCEQLYQDYLNDPDPEKDDFITLEEYAKELGIELGNDT